MSKLDELLDGKNWGIGEGAEGNSVDVFYGDDYRGNFLLPEARAELAQLRAELEKRVPCPECGGVDPKGEQDGNYFCGMCGGQGSVPNGVPGCRLKERTERLVVS